MAHTPGPWHVNSKRPTLVNGPENAPGTIVDCGANIEYLEAIANARLIAAAPDLLEDCENLVGLLEHADLGYYSNDPIVISARQTIAKAKEVS